MDLTSIFSQYLGFISDIRDITLLVFVLCLLGEAIGIGIPYLLETSWLMTGYNLSNGVFSWWFVILLLLVAQAGRMCGAMVLYTLSIGGNVIWEKYKKYLKIKSDISSSIPFRWFKPKNIYSPYSVALGRLLWLRLPITLILGANRKWKVLLLGILISGLAFDSIPIIIGGIVGKTAQLTPTEIFLYSMIGLTSLYILTFSIRKIIQVLRRNRVSEVS
jgi:membrane-associated protein